MVVRQQPASDDVPKESPQGFFVFWPQRDRTRVLHVEEVGEFIHSPGASIRYPATLGFFDGSLAKPLDALLEFEDLLNDSRTPEATYQRFFERLANETRPELST